MKNDGLLEQAYDVILTHVRSCHGVISQVSFYSATNSEGIEYHGLFCHNCSVHFESWIAEYPNEEKVYCCRCGKETAEWTCYEVPAKSSDVGETVHTKVSNVGERILVCPLCFSDEDEEIEN